jgi:hypothetical protein
MHSSSPSRKCSPNSLACLFAGRRRHRTHLPTCPPTRPHARPAWLRYSNPIVMGSIIRHGKCRLCAPAAAFAAAIATAAAAAFAPPCKQASKHPNQAVPSPSLSLSFSLSLFLSCLLGLSVSRQSVEAAVNQSERRRADG